MEDLSLKVPQRSLVAAITWATAAAGKPHLLDHLVLRIGPASTHPMHYDPSLSGGVGINAYALTLAGTDKHLMSWTTFALDTSSGEPANTPDNVEPLDVAVTAKSLLEAIKPSVKGARANAAMVRIVVKPDHLTFTFDTGTTTLVPIVADMCESGGWPSMGLVSRLTSSAIEAANSNEPAAISHFQPALLARMFTAAAKVRTATSTPPIVTWVTPSGYKAMVASLGFDKETTNEVRCSALVMPFRVPE